MANQFYRVSYFNNDRSGRIICNNWRLGHSQIHAFGDLIINGHNDLALVGSLIWPLNVLDLQSVGRAGSIVPHTVMKKKIREKEYCTKQVPKHISICGPRGNIMNRGNDAGILMLLAPLNVNWSYM